MLPRKGDGLAYPPRYETPLNRGVEASPVVSSRDGSVQIELAGGEVGWGIPRGRADRRAVSGGRASLLQNELIAAGDA